MDAIRSTLALGSRTLVVQRTGWGKSVVYFLATRLLREQGAALRIVMRNLLLYTSPLPAYFELSMFPVSQKTLPRSNSPGFSLVEVTMAIGILLSGAALDPVAARLHLEPCL